MDSAKGPTRPGLWLRKVGMAGVHAAEIIRNPMNMDMLLWSWGWNDAMGQQVEDDGRWLCEIPTPDDLAAQSAELERLRAIIRELEYSNAGKFLADPEGEPDGPYDACFYCGGLEPGQRPPSKLDGHQLVEGEPCYVGSLLAAHQEPADGR